MSNKIYTVKIAEAHMATIIEALGALPFSRVQSIVVSLVSQANIQTAREKAEAEQAANTNDEAKEDKVAEAAE